jgi:UDP-N-acetylmuramoyl-tripeptide--D-alanyl-D-alanine ligase
MAILKVEEIIKATGGKLLSENSKTFSGVSIDSRTITDGEVFFAIRGERFDGHTFLKEALLKGSGAVVDSKPALLPEGKVIICVDDTLRSLQELAHFLRMKRNTPVVAVTGSNGKTTTKEMIYSILSKRFKSLKNTGNLNNQIGLPLSLLKLEPDDEIIVLEMGMNTPGEIRRLCEIAVPSHGIVTNIGSAHVGKLGSYVAVRDAKLEILQGLSIAIVNADDNLLLQGIVKEKDFNGQLITFAIKNDAHIMAKDIRATEKGNDFMLDFKNKGSIPVSLNVYGLFNVYNALAAAAASFYLGMTLQEIKAALETYRAFSMRFDVVRKNGITVINDSYNANPSSMEESIKELSCLGGKGRVVAILGDMRELHEFSEYEHRNIGKIVSDMGVEVFIAVGEMMELAANESLKATGREKVPEVFTFRDIDKAKKDIMKILKKGDTVLIKGSRSMSMERIMGSI